MLRGRGQQLCRHQCRHLCCRWWKLGRFSLRPQLLKVFSSKHDERTHDRLCGDKGLERAVTALRILRLLPEGVDY
ncbi:hypothetical protein CERZMDRAFT_122129 [Cercospora zeae-maydis SCOH1-5]|uniref:Uncharacterized protein n=1 Tax=Cercospora zeae-maydis SCOH1-5 TaxID=717836 RepID=A0A6A6F707_9PEZI|nr:hypothetical protein CERZMDRAFT_122129 [Cercospora zeae-maydis SCOH1-5]